MKQEVYFNDTVMSYRNELSVILREEDEGGRVTLTVDAQRENEGTLYHLYVHTADYDPLLNTNVDSGLGALI